MGDSTINTTHAAAEDQVTRTDKPCLNRVRNDLRSKKVEAYKPCVVSLGCFHSRQFSYELNAFKRNNFPPKKLPKRDDELNKLSDKIIEVHGNDIREWYGLDQNNDYWSDRELGTNMAKDGLFLLQFLCQVSPKAAKNRKAARYISQIQHIFAVEEDIMKLENQISLFVLKTVIEWEAQTYQWILTGDHVLKSILKQAVWHTLSPFAYNIEDLLVLDWRVFVNYKSHLLEFVYDSIIAGFEPVFTVNQFDRKNNYKKIIDLPRVEQLHKRGVKFAKQKRDDQYKISFDRKTCTLKLPAIEMDHRTDAVIRNLLAFEDMKNAEKPLRCYVEMMNRLIDTAEDVQLLRKEGIIRSGLGSDQQVADTWNDMTQGLEKSTSYGPIDSVIDEVVTIYTSKYRILWAEFKQKHLSKPWLALALIGGCISLLLSVAQTILAWEQVRLQRETMK